MRGAVLSRCTISQVRPAQQTVILYSLQRCAFYPRPRRPQAAPPLSQSSRGSSLQRRGSTERQLHRLRTHGFHPVSQDALSHRYTPAERRTHQRMAEQVSARCTLCTPAPLDTPRQHARVLTRRPTKSLWTRPPRGLDAFAPAPLSSTAGRPSAVAAPGGIPAMQASTRRAQGGRNICARSTSAAWRSPKSMARRCHARYTPRRVSYRVRVAWHIFARSAWPNFPGSI